MPEHFAGLCAEGAFSIHEALEEKELLRFITCGSVDDGKSTLIGRLLYDSQFVLEDQLVALSEDSRKHGTVGEGLDLALLVDGLEAEREQGITIDVAYRFFSTSKRRFIIADTPGHVEYTRNMATGASTADLAIVLVDSQRGILSQTRRHTYIASMLNVRHLVLAINKMDLIAYSQAQYEQIAKEFRSFAADLGFLTIETIPISARLGENVTVRSDNMAWYNGPTLIEQLDSVPIEGESPKRAFRLPVQLVLRPDSSFRGFCGQIASGEISIGEAIVVSGSGRSSTVREIVSTNGPVASAFEGQAVTVVLDDDIDISRGNILSKREDRPHLADQFQARILWFGPEPMLPGRSYYLRTEADNVSATVTALKYAVNIETLARLPAKTLTMNEFGVCNISTQRQVAFDAYSNNRVTGNFILVDRLTNTTVGAGMIEHPLRRAENIHWQTIEINGQERALLKHQKPMVLWFTGLSGSGKSTIANILEKLLHTKGRHSYILDGDNVRHGLNRDLGFKNEDRVENIRRVAEVAKLMADAGLIVIVSLISPFQSERDLARGLMNDYDFVEVFVDTPLDECARRDPKGLYKKASDGSIKNFTGIDSPYEVPPQPDLHMSTVGSSPEQLAKEIFNYVEGRLSNDGEST